MGMVAEAIRIRMPDGGSYLLFVQRIAFKFLAAFKVFHPLTVGG
jgi:hypothetical protein